MKFEQKLCPFCKKDNNCMVENPTSCWCMKTKVPKELRQLLPKSNTKSCICKSCVLEFTSNPEAFKDKYSSI